MMAKLDKPDDAFQDVVNDVVRNLIQIRYRHPSAYINLPLLYPSGSHVSVRIDQIDNERFLVSDAGMGFDEADLACIGDQFTQIAPSIANKVGVYFENQTFSLEASREQLAGTVSVIANCSHEAVRVSASSKPNISDEPVLARSNTRPIPWPQILLTPSSAQLISLLKLLQQVQEIGNKHEGVENFDATESLLRWLTEPLPALGGHKPIEYLNTTEGQAQISSLLRQNTTGAYA